MNKLEFEFEYQREAPICLFYVWNMGHIYACEQILGLDSELAKKVFAINENGIWKVYTQKDNLLKIKQAIKELKPNLLEQVIDKYLEDYKTLQKQPDLALNKKFISHLFGGFVITFIIGDIEGSTLQSKAISAREKTEKIFYNVWNVLKEASVDTDNFERYTYNEIVSNTKASKEDLNERNRALLYNSSIAPINNYNKDLEDYLEKEKIELHSLPIVLHKEHSRAYSLAKLLAWHKSLDYYFPEIIGLKIENTTFIFNGDELVDGYYEQIEIDKIFKAILNFTNEDHGRMERHINKFLNLFNELKEYFIGKKEVESIKEFKDIMEKYALYWTYVAIVFVLPSFEVPKILQDQAMAARTITQEYNEHIEGVISKFVDKKFPSLKGKYRFILPDEIFNGDAEKTELMLDRIKERENGYLLYQGQLYTGDYKKIVEKYNLVIEDQEIESAQDFKGQVAYKGKVKGKVRVINKVSQVNEFKEGEIMVAAMTMPSYLPAMQKVAAFITDEGGVTCHAAIVSREMKKPCIIGTKVATQVLKDGDEVEVDADNGVVKIIK